MENKNIKNLYKIYPIIKKIDNDNNGIIGEKAIFKNVIKGEYLSTGHGACLGVLFVLKGSINIQRVNEEGEETNLYNINKGDLCHEAFSCFLSCEPLNIIGKAIENSEVCIIPLEISKVYLIKNTLFLNYIYRDLYKKFKNVIENKEEIIHESLDKRLIKLLIEKESKVIYVTHSELAFELDSAREVISRKLKKLEKNGYIKMQRGKINILKDLNEIL